MDNIAQYGFRPYRSGLSSAGLPAPIPMVIATAASFDVTSGAANVNLGVGDPVYKLNSGTGTLCPGAETTVQAPFGIVVGVAPSWDAARGVMQPREFIPSDTAWGTIEDHKSVAYVIPIRACLWEIDCDDAVTATTLAAYRLLLGLNCDFMLKGASGETRAKPQLDISSAATTNTLILRIYAISETVHNRDFSGANVKLVVGANIAQDDSTTGV
jgi:hypothetical protein